jgi:short subunit dehydrogenase-like uncharacterized protein
MPDDRPFDLVLFGATGFTGQLTAAHLAGNVPDGCRWALAGRNQAKLEDVRRSLAEAHPTLADLPLVIADVGDPASMASLAESTRVVASTVGPYLDHGDPLVAACAAAGTDYLDITGEPEFVDRTYLRHHDRAVATGARLVHACGFDSVPHDLGVLRTVQLLPEGVPLTVHGFVSAGGAPSGGTVRSAVTAFGRLAQMTRTARERRSKEGTPAGRSAEVVRGPLRHDGRWAVPFPSLDPQVVVRSARANERYGPDFSYSHSILVGNPVTAAGLVAGSTALVATAQVPPLRRLLLDRIPEGSGPSPERRARSWFSVRFVGEGGGQRVLTEVAGGDPGYDETATMLGQSMLSLAFDDLPPTSGQVTTATAMGDALIDRLQQTGMAFRTLDG